MFRTKTLYIHGNPIGNYLPTVVDQQKVELGVKPHTNKLNKPTVVG